MHTAEPEYTQHSIGTALTSSRVHIALILLVGIIAYVNSFTVPMQFDDYRTLAAAYKNVSSGGASLFSTGASRWVADLTFALDRYVHGYWMQGYHFVNLVIHVSAALVVYGFVDLILKACRPEKSITDDIPFYGRFVPVATALLFVCHPIQTEAVTYISQRYTSLASLFYLLALFCYSKARRSLTLTPTESLSIKKMGWWFAFTVSALLAMKCKQISVTLPVMVAILEGSIYRGRLLKKVPFLVLLAALLMVVPIQEIYSSPAATRGSLSQVIGQASSETDVISRYSYFLTQQRVEVTYLRLLLFPINQNLDYDYPLYSSLKEWPVAASLAVNSLLVCLGIYLLIRSRRHNPEQGSKAVQLLAGLGIIWFYVTLSVESSVIPISDLIFEHRLYLPSVGFFMAVTAGISGVAVRYPGAQRFVLIAATVVVTALTTATILRNNVWNSDLGMWMDVLEKSPNKARSRYLAATLFLKKNMLDQAIQNFVRAIELDPSRDVQRISLNHTIATMFPEFEKRSSTGGEYQTEFERVNPSYYPLWLAVSYNNLGLAYELLNNPDRARYYYSLAVIKNPGLDVAWYNMALAAAKHHDTELFQQAVGRLESLHSKLLPLLISLQSREKR